MQAAPFVDTIDDYLAAAASFSLLILFVCCIGFKDAAIFDLADIQEKMSREQISTYVVDSGVLTIIVIMALLLSIVMSGVLFLVQLAAEAKRVRDEAAKNKARRLRYVKDDKEVPPPPVAELGYHTFLSHVWGTGQDQMRIVKQRLLEMINGLSVFRAPARD